MATAIVWLTSWMRDLDVVELREFGPRGELGSERATGRWLSAPARSWVLDDRQVGFSGEEFAGPYRRSPHYNSSQPTESWRSIAGP